MPVSDLVVAVSGATGHIGGVLVRALVRSPQVAEVRTVARRPLRIPGGPGPYGQACSPEGPVHQAVHRHLQADVGSPQARRLVAGCDILYHLAAQVWQGRGAGAVERMRDVNIAGTANLAGAAGAVVLASSVAVYGAWPDNPLPMEERWPARPNPECSYAAHKLLAEQACADNARTCSVVRLSAVLGPHADARVARAVAGYRVVVPAVRGCAQAVQWLHEDDAVTALISAGQALLEGRADGVFNVATPDWLIEDDVAELSGGRVVRAPRRAVLAVAELGRTLRMSPFGADRAALICGPLAVSCERAATVLGWRATRTSRQVLGEALRDGWRQAPLNRGPPA